MHSMLRQKESCTLVGHQSRITRQMCNPQGSKGRPVCRQRFRLRRNITWGRGSSSWCVRHEPKCWRTVRQE
eukprot:1173838-Alexandrium_andersonii.AAC.1